MPILNPAPVPSVIDKDDEIAEETVNNAPPAETTKVVEPKTRMEYFLNKIADAVNGESGDTPVSGGMLVVNIIDGSNAKTEETPARFDKTAAEVYSALTTTGCVVVYDGGISQIAYGTYHKNSYLFIVYMESGTEYFTALNADDYPIVNG